MRQKVMVCRSYYRRGITFGEGFCKSAAVLFLFYRSAMAVAGGILYGIYSVWRDRKKRREHWQRQLNLEFREGLQGIAAALNAGYSFENAFREAEKDLKLLYGEASVLAPEIEEMIRQLELNCPVEQVLSELAERSGVEDIERFADVFQTAKRTGGNLITITKTTAERISEKIEVKREIQTMIAGKQMEARIMSGVPLGMILYFWICSPGFLDCMYTGNGRVVMTVLLGMYFLAYQWSTRICQISV